jgi:hypothetical protein
MPITTTASTDFTPSELDTLRDHGIVLFANRVIFEAQPPMSEADIAAVQALCSGPIPEPLLELWRVTAGGSLDYALSVNIRGNREAMSWNELFYNGSHAYHDLKGWIDHELELAEEVSEARGQRWNGKLDALPFGGFEYCDRVYAIVESGREHGHILAWKRGLPPAWTHQLHEDGIATIGPDLHSAFAALHLPEDPLKPSEDNFEGSTFLPHLQARVDEHGLDRELADRLITFYRLAIRDWRPKLADGTLAADRELALNALEHAIGTDDAALIKELAAARVLLDVRLRGDASPLEMALTRAAFGASQALIDVGAPVSSRCMSDIHKPAPLPLIESLLAKGAHPALSAVIACAEYGSDDAARLIARACAARDPAFRRSFAEAQQQRVKELEEDLRRVRARTLSHYFTEAELQEHIDNLTSSSAAEKASLRASWTWFLRRRE